MKKLKTILAILCVLTLTAGSVLTAAAAGEDPAAESTSASETTAVSGQTSLRPEEDLTVMLPAYQYEPDSSVEVNGRQGVCCEGDAYWVSGSATLTKYDKDWNVIAENDDPFKGYETEVNHIGDIDVYNNELYIGAEYFMDGVGKNIQIAVYDGDTLELKRTFPFEPESGQLECSGIAVDPDAGIVWMCSWVGEESGRYLYKYDLKTGEYLGKVHLQMPPQWLQGVAYYNGCLYMTADDGDADNNEPDHLYRTKIADGATCCTVTLERTFDDVTRQGEIEGLTFDKTTGQFLLLYNRGARIVLGMPKGFYDGYDKEISEVFVYDTTPSETTAAAASSEDAAGSQEESIDYMVLVNKLHPLPEGWEDQIETVHFTNSEGYDVEVEAKAYEAYLLLKEELEKEGIFVDLDNAYRSVAEQQKVMDEFIEEYGKEYAQKTVAKPGYSEHQTGLALDLYLTVDGKNIVENEDLMQYPEIWEKIFEKIADYGFILRYLEDKEYITGYAYEPWHIRYLDNVDAAKEIMDAGITYEGWLGEVRETVVDVDYGKSQLYTQDELKDAAVQVKCDFASWAGCELHNLRYAGDECCTEEIINWLNSISDGEEYTQVAEFLMDFHSPVEGGGAWEADTEYKDYQWWLGRNKDGDWDVITNGY